MGWSGTQSGCSCPYLLVCFGAGPRCARASAFQRAVALSLAWGTTRVCPLNRMPSEPVRIATLTRSRPASWHSGVARVHHAAIRKVSGEQRRVAGDRSELFAERVVLTLVWGVRV
jgi:hypothetical protein